MWLPAWLPGDDPRPSTFQVVSDSVANCHFAGKAGFLAVWLPLDVCGFCPVLGTRMARGPSPRTASLGTGLS